jgi:hypothetical protein
MIVLPASVVSCRGGDIRLVVFFLSLMAVSVAALTWIGAQRIQFTDVSIRVLAGPGRGNEIAWKDVSRVNVTTTSMLLGSRTGRRPIVFRIRLYDGYPELAECVLRCAPKNAIRDAQADLLRSQASLLDL